MSSSVLPKPLVPMTTNLSSRPGRQEGVDLGRAVEQRLVEILGHPDVVGIHGPRAHRNFPRALDGDEHRAWPARASSRALAARIEPCPRSASLVPLTSASMRAALARALAVVALALCAARRRATPGGAGRRRCRACRCRASACARATSPSSSTTPIRRSVEIGRYYAAQARHRRRSRRPRPLSGRPGGDELRRLHARPGGPRRQGRRRRAGASARLDAAVPGRVHVGHGGVRARLRPGVVLRRRLPDDEALALLQQHQPRAVHRPPPAPGDAARRRRRRERASG